MPLIRKQHFSIGGNLVKLAIKYDPKKEKFFVELPPDVVRVITGNSYVPGLYEDTEAEALTKAKEAIKAYEAAVKDEKRVILYDFDRGTQQHHWINGRQADIHGFTLRWEFARMVTVDGKSVFYTEKTGQKIHHDAQYVVWTEDREKFFVGLCQQLDRLEAGAALFFEAEGVGERIDAITPRLQSGEPPLLLAIEPKA